LIGTDDDNNIEEKNADIKQDNDKEILDENICID
jgi:hypothetical protein